MNSITKDYLVGIIFKKTSETIDRRREAKQRQFDNEPYPGATDEEALDFIISIPYFDEKLKDFFFFFARQPGRKNHHHQPGLGE